MCDKPCKFGIVFEGCGCLAELERVLRLDLSNAMLGINNRNLEDFTVDLGNTRAIMQSPAGQEVPPKPLLP